MAALRTARSHGLAVCKACGQLSRAVSHNQRCPRCGAGVHTRLPRSVSRTWALLLAAAILYVPANLLPIMAVTSLVESREDTIFSGVIYLVALGMWPLALIVFVASIVVPLSKMAIIAYLLVSVQRRSAKRPLERMQLYRFTDFVGRWSMVDVFVVTILIALVQMGNVAGVEAAPGAGYFAAVVILTMLAAHTFDPRLIWDNVSGDDGQHEVARQRRR